MKILHIDTGKEWRGGQRQALFLHEGLLKSGIESYMVCNSRGELCKKDVAGLLPIEFEGEADLNFLSSLKKVIKEIKPDIVHTHDAHSLTPALLAKITGRSFKLINTRRVDFSTDKGFIKKKKYNNVMVDRVVAISEAIRNILINDGINSAKIPVINSGVKFPKSINFQRVIELREKYNLTDCDFVIGNIANISDHKDHYTLLNAFDIFSRSVDDAILVLVGDGPMYDEIHQYASTLDCFNNVVFTGHVTDVYEHIALFDLFCMSSKTEGLCTSIIDAFFMGKPVVATRAGGIPELVKHGFNGYLSDVGDADRFAANIEAIYDDATSEAKFSANAYHTALKFSDGSMVTKYIKLYRELIS